jgi:hypothetical protein
MELFVHLIYPIMASYHGHLVHYAGSPITAVLSLLSIHGSTRTTVLTLLPLPSSPTYHGCQCHGPSCLSRLSCRAVVRSTLSIHFNRSWPSCGCPVKPVFPRLYCHKHHVLSLSFYDFPLRELSCHTCADSHVITHPGFPKIVVPLGYPDMTEYIKYLRHHTPLLLSISTQTPPPPQMELFV